VNLLTYTQEFDNPAWSKNGTTVIPNQNPTAASLGPELGAAAAINIRPATGGTVTRSGGIITFTSPASGLSTAVSQEVTGLTIGRMYRFNGRMRRTAGANAASPQIRDASGGGGNGLLVGPGVTTDWVSFSLYWIANVTTAYFSFASGGASQTIEISEAEYSVREVIGGFITAPDGTLTGDLLAETTTNAGHTVSASATLITAPYALSVYLKKGTGATAPNWVQLYTGGTSTQYANFNLATGTVGNVAVGSTATITDVGNGWYRCALVFVPPAAGAAALVIAFTNNTDTTTRGLSYAGATTSDVFVWGAQLEAVPDANLVLGSELNVSTPPFTVFRDGVTNTPSPTLMTTTANRAYRVQLVISTNTSTVTASFRVAGSSSGGAISPGQVGDNTYYTTGGSGGALAIAGDTTGVNLTVTSVSVREITGVTAMPSAYAKNVGGLFPARFDYDPVTLAPRGILIEEQRANLLVYSEDWSNAAWTKQQVTITTNATLSPDGTTNADKIVEDSSTAVHRTFQTITKAASAITYTFTVFVKAAERTTASVFMQDSTVFAQVDINLLTGALSNIVGTVSATNFGNGWWRVSVSGTSGTVTTALCMVASNNGGSFAGTAGFGIFAYGAQAETGSFATSYIPTVASTVTRTADIANVTAANFSSWYNQPQGTFVVEATQPAATGVNSRSLSANDGTVNESVQVSFLSTGNGGYGEVRDGGTAVVSITNGSFAVGSVAKMAFAVAANNAALSVNGASPTTDTSLTMPAVDRLNIGTHAGAASPLNGHVRSIRYYPARLNNAQLQTLTA
jgi:hypothetical protein